MVNMRDRLGAQGNRLVAKARDQSFVTEAETKDALYAITARELEHEAAHDIVDARTQAAAGYNAAAHGTWIEEYLVARSGQLEGGQCRCFGGVGANDGH